MLPLQNSALRILDLAAHHASCLLESLRSLGVTNFDKARANRDVRTCFWQEFDVNVFMTQTVKGQCQLDAVVVLPDIQFDPRCFEHVRHSVLIAA